MGINSKKYFSIQQAEELLPLVYRMTEETQKEFKKISKCLETLPQKKTDRSVELEIQLDKMVERWKQKISRLGAQPKGLWLVDFDFGSGYWCWKYPETQIQYYHGYQDGFSGRKKIDRNILEMNNESRPRTDQPHPR